MQLLRAKDTRGMVGNREQPFTTLPEFATEDTEFTEIQGKCFDLSN